MIGLPSSVRVFLATEPTDMRKGHDGLAALVAAQGNDVYSGHLFVFLSKRCNRAKVLWWDRGGYVLWYKRLERGRFRRPHIASATNTVRLDPAQLAMLLDGVDLDQVRRTRAWKPKLKSTKGIDKTVKV